MWGIFYLIYNDMTSKRCQINDKFMLFYLHLTPLGQSGSILMCQDSKPGENEYGPNPKEVVA